MGRCRIISPSRLTNRLPEMVEITHHAVRDGGRVVRGLDLLRLCFAVRSHDIFLVLNANADMMMAAFLSRHIFRSRARILFFDTLLHRPVTMRDRILCRLRRLLLSTVDVFLSVHKDTEGYEKYYGIPRDKFAYVPFKANNHAYLSRYPVSDEGYVLSCGASYRDFATLIRAVDKLGFPTRIVLPGQQIAAFHNTVLDDRDVPPNVDIIRHDFDRDTWNAHLAGARVIVIPLLKGTIQPAGISVYLEAMALGKPVVITEGPSTTGLLTGNEAEMVPPDNAEALAGAVRKLWNDEGYRSALAERGRQYALSLGDEERLVRDLLRSSCQAVSPA